MVLNLHAIANRILNSVNEEIEILLVRTKLTYSAGSLEPVKTAEEMNLRGRIQPFNSKRHTSFTKIQEIARAFTSTNATLTENIYVVYLTGFATMQDQRGLVADDAMYARGKKYVVIENVPWKGAGWVEVLAREENDDRDDGEESDDRGSS